MTRFILMIILTFSINAFADVYTDVQSAAEAAGVEKGLALSLVQKTKSAGFSTRNMERIAEMIKASKGAESTKLTQKTLEGIAKNVPEQRVVSAMEKVAERYETARQIAVRAQIDRKTAETFSEMAADAMAAGADEKNLNKVAEAVAQQKESREAYALAVMSLYREMSRFGTEDVKAAEVALMAVKKLNASQIHEYRKAFMQNAGYGGANQTAESMGRSISRGSGASSVGGGSGGGSGSAGGSSGSSGGGGGNGGGRH